MTLRRHRDGEIFSSNILINKSSDNASKYTNNGHYKAVILRAIPKDDPRSFSKESVEYDIQIISGIRRGEIYRGCRSLDTFGGVNNFNEIVYAPKTKVLKGKDQGDLTQPDDTDGSYVIVSFVNGYFHAPFIVGGWRQPNNTTHGATLADGNIVRGQFQDLTWLIDSDGKLTIDHSGTSFVLDNEGKITITTTAETTINSEGNTIVNSQSNVQVTSQGNTTIDATGNVVITAQQINLTGSAPVSVTGASISLSGSGGISFIGPTVTIGSDGASEHIILGDLFKAYFDTHSHPSHGAPPSTPMPSSTLSTKSTVE